MTVRELKSILSQYDDDCTVEVKDNNIVINQDYHHITEDELSNLYDEIMAMDINDIS